jgi:hypothetical protein
MQEAEDHSSKPAQAKRKQDPITTKMLSVVVHIPVVPAPQEAMGRQIVVQNRPRQKVRDRIRKITSAKKPYSMAEVDAP